MPETLRHGVRPVEYRFAVEREPLIRPFHFKGGSFTEKWLTVTSLRSADSGWVTAVGGLAVLWSDPEVFSAWSETGGNLLMALIAERAAQLVRGGSWPAPLPAIEAVLPELHRFGQAVAERPNLRPTFTLNSLVSLDLALWKLLAIENGTEELDRLIPARCRPALAHRQERLLRVPLVTYNTSIDEVVRLVQAGHSLLKIKIGQPGSVEEMLEKDRERLRRIHAAVQDLPAEHTRGGRVLYYLDANGRYPQPSALLRLLEEADRIGMLERVTILEEPFPDDLEIDVSGLPVRVAADESLHSPADVHRRIDLGYGAIALKPAGKTLSMSLEMARAAAERSVPCFVADSAGVPLLVEWNKNVAARLADFPGLSMGILESNGAQNYRDWGRMAAGLPLAGAPWVEPKGGVYRLDAGFYRSSGGIFRSAGPYERLVLPGGDGGGR